jgi:hypothetical protein
MAIFVAFFIVAPLLALIPATIAKNKGRSFGGWWFYGWLLWIVALPHALLMSSRMNDNQRKCPACAEYVKKEALRCKHCGEVFKTETKLGLECPKCHKNYDTSWKICLQCNMPLVAKSVEAKE